MPSRIEAAILDEANKLIRRHQRYALALEEECRRRVRRSGLPTQKNVQLPSYWSVDSGFNPYYVRSHVGSIAYAIRKALRTGTYKPRPAVIYEVPKKDGGTRRISVFQVADNAVSRI